MDLLLENPHDQSYRLFFDLFLNATTIKQLFSESLKLLEQTLPIDHGWAVLLDSDSTIVELYSISIKSGTSEISSGVQACNIPKCLAKILHDKLELHECDGCSFFDGKKLIKNIFPLMNNHSDLTGVLSLALDKPLSDIEELRLRDVVTDMNTALKRIIKSDNATHKMFNFFQQPLALMLVCDLDGTIKEANETWTALLGYPVREIIGKQITDYIHPVDLEISISRFTQLLNGADSTVSIIRMKNSNGSHRWIHWSSKMDVEMGEVYGYGIDISEQKKIESELKESTKRFETVVHNSTPIIVLYDTNGIIQLSEGRSLVSVGLKPGEEIGISLYDLYADKPVILDGTSRSLKGETIAYNVTVRNVEFEVHQSPAFDHEGTLIGGMAMAIDISKRLEVESEKSMLLSVIKQAAETILITDTKGNITFVNPSFEETTGYTLPECIGRNPRFLQSKRHDDNFYKELWDTLLSTGIWCGTLYNKTKNGDELIEKAVITGARNIDGEITHYIGVMRDITHEIKLEQQLQQAEKMDAVGKLASGIAHDFNNILGAIIGYAEMASLELTDNNRAGVMIENVVKASDRAKQLVSQILTFSRKGETKEAPIYIGEIIKEVTHFVRATIPSTISIKTDIHKENRAIIADVIKVHEVVMNLCTNAAQSIYSYGEIVISLKEVTVNTPLLGLMGELEKQTYSVVSIKDSGSGMSDKMINQIFEPYFTSKEVGKGTGLGLSVVFGIIKKMNGNLTVHSTLGKGTTFTIYFPQTNKIPQSVKESGEVLVGTESILLVDDDIMLGEMLNTMLTTLGYSVTYCSNSLDALDLYEEEQSKFDIIITDETMPFLKGSDFARQIRKQDRDIPIILCTGAVHDGITDDINSSVNKVLKKPLKREEIAFEIRNCFDESQQK